MTPTEMTAKTLPKITGWMIETADGRRQRIATPSEKIAFYYFNAKNAVWCRPYYDDGKTCLVQA